MPSIPNHLSPTARRAARARAPTVLGVALALLVGLAALALRPPAEPDHASPAPPSRQPSPAFSPERTAPRSPSAPGSPRPGAATSTDLGPRDVVAARLREILHVREEAFGRRDMRLLETIYTADCPCLRTGRAAIARLLADRVLWRGRAVAVEVSGVERFSDLIWVAVALLSSRAFRIERDDGALVRTVPAERRPYRLVLVRSAPGGQWLLGDASLLEGGAP